MLTESNNKTLKFKFYERVKMNSNTVSYVKDTVNVVIT